MVENGKGEEQEEATLALHQGEGTEENERRRGKRGGGGFFIVIMLYAPIRWLEKLVVELNWSFVLAVVIVYGINQGFGMGLSRVSVPYYMKDEQKLQPSEAQIYSGIIQIPWIVKPLWGLLTDTVPIFGYRRKPYFLLSGLLIIVSMLVLSLRQKESLAFALTTLMTASAGAAIADVTVDACVTQNSITHPSLAGDMQSLCGFSSSIGALVGFSLSGIFVHLVGSKGVFGMLSVPASLVIVGGVLLKESRVPNVAHQRLRGKFVDAATTMWTTVKCRQVWRPCLYMYLSLALSLNIREGMFYWYTDAEDGPKFSQAIVGSILSFGAIGSLVGVFVYQNFLKGFRFRDTLLWAQLLYSAAGLLDLVLVLRINLKLGMPDYLFVVMDDLVSMLIVRMKWMPLLVLSSKLCPAGIEGTFFALLMSIDHVGLLSSSWTGGFLLHVLKVTRTEFGNLWMAVLIRSLMRVLPVGLLFLIPRSDPTMQILPNEMLRTKKSEEEEEEEEEEKQQLEMASLLVDHNATR